MKFVPYEKSSDIIAMFALKTSILCAHSRGDLQVRRENLATTKEYQLFGIQDNHGLMIGAIDFIFSPKHGTCRAGIFLENGSVSLSDACAHAKQVAKNAGLAKISVSVLCGEDRIADTMKEIGFLPEVKYRAHMFIGGALFSVTEYGCVI